MELRGLEHYVLRHHPPIYSHVSHVGGVRERVRTGVEAALGMAGVRVTLATATVDLRRLVLPGMQLALGQPSM